MENNTLNFTFACDSEQIPKSCCSYYDSLQSNKILTTPLMYAVCFVPGNDWITRILRNAAVCDICERWLHGQALSCTKCLKKSATSS